MLVLLLWVGSSLLRYFLRGLCPTTFKIRAGMSLIDWSRATYQFLSIRLVSVSCPVMPYRVFPQSLNGSIMQATIQSSDGVSGSKPSQIS
ncbi:hypothetical protein R3W88_024673 [Solanum pinnatisectum]|uniref:Secreted protein n=1 Tax=Solanum pinnatisectum TaxID=50273 RepID=A0AAV9M3Z7_9SOLN|nr:hypothetical protein R3W88_024673 [Solanum pinnatisectum]